MDYGSLEGSLVPVNASSVHFRGKLRADRSILASESGANFISSGTRRVRSRVEDAPKVSFFSWTGASRFSRTEFKIERFAMDIRVFSTYRRGKVSFVSRCGLFRESSLLEIILDPWYVFPVDDNRNRVP